MPLIKVTPSKDRRVLHFGNKGKDVKAYQRMLTRTLKHLGLVTVNRQTGLYGKGTVLDTLMLQHQAHIKADGKVGPLTWSAVDPQMHAYERFLLKWPTPPPPDPSVVLGNKIAHELEVMYALKLDFYSQDRPGATNLPYPWKRKADCSDSYLLAVARARGVPYDGWGNTTTIWTTFSYVADGDVQNGDAALFGRRGKTTHVQGVSDATNKKDPMTIGFGNAPGTKARKSYRQSEFMGYRRPPQK